MNIIGDVAGEFDTLMLLVDQMPKDKFLFCADLIDRGPKSKEVVDWVMKNAKCVLGNHEHLMLNEILGLNYYEDGTWYYNGGMQTLESYLHRWDENAMDILKFRRRAMACIPQEHIEWMKSLPLYYEEKGLFVSHAARDKNKARTLEECTDLGKGFRDQFRSDLKSEFSLIWNRGSPRRVENVFQVYGHNSYRDVMFFSEKYQNGVGVPHPDAFAACIDTSRAKKLSGIHWPSLEVFEQEYV